MNINIKTFIATNVFVELFKQVGDTSCLHGVTSQLLSKPGVPQSI